MEPTKRFSNRVDAYRLYRPHYPPLLIDALVQKLPLHAVVADIGAGTGIFSEQLQQAGLRVIAVEPNAQMRAAIQANIFAVDGTAEATGLVAHSVDVVTAAQAFHWFNLDLTRVEFRRILKSQGIVFSAYNTRLRSTPFMSAYEHMLQKFCPEYTQVDHTHVNTEVALQDFLAPNSWTTQIFPNAQQLTEEQFIGRYLSSSYAIRSNAALTYLRELFTEYQIDGEVTFSYSAELSWGNFD